MNEFARTSVACASDTATKRLSTVGSVGWRPNHAERALDRVCQACRGTFADGETDRTEQRHEQHESGAFRKGDGKRSAQRHQHPASQHLSDRCDEPHGKRRALRQARCS